MKSARVIAFAIACLLFAGRLAAYELKFVADTFPPFTGVGIAGDRVAGPVAEVVRAVCRRIGATCTLELQPWARATAMVDSGEAQALFALPLNADSEEKFLLSETIVDSAISLFAPAASHFSFRAPADLEACTVGVQAGSPAAELLAAALRQSSGCRAEADLNNVLVLKKLASGRYGDAERSFAAIDRGVALHLMQHEGIGGLREVGNLSPIAYGVGFAKRQDNAAPFKDFNRALKALAREGKIRRIVAKYGLRAP